MNPDIQIETNEAVTEHVAIPETQPTQKIEDHEVPSNDTDCLIAEEEPVEDLVEIIDLTDKATQEEKVNERRQSIVIEPKDEVQVCDLEHPQDGHLNEKLIKDEVVRDEVNIINHFLYSLNFPLLIFPK